MEIPHKTHPEIKLHVPGLDDGDATSMEGPKKKDEAACNVTPGDLGCSGAAAAAGSPSGSSSSELRLPFPFFFFGLQRPLVGQFRI
jgi:hypothetical protein